MTPSPVPRAPLRALVMLLVLMACAVPANAAAQPAGSIAERLEPVFRYYSELEFQKGIDLAGQLLQEPGLTDQDRIAIYSLLSMLTFAQGESRLNQSFAYLQKIAEIGPCMAPLPSDYWPQTLRDQWYRIMHGSGSLVCPEPAAAAGAGEAAERPRTVAVMEFDNYSVGQYQEKLGYLAKGLADFFEADFAHLSTLRVVERDKIDFIRNEIMMTKEGLVDEAAAVRIGKLVGARIMVFGSILQISDKEARMIVKAVDVETSRILAFAERKGRPDFFAMQGEVVVDLVEKLEPLVSAEDVETLQANGTRDEAAAELYSKGLYHMDNYQYAKAYDFFRQAYEKDGTFIEAKRKMDVYRPLVLAAG